MAYEITQILIILGIGALAGWLAGNFIRGGGFGLIGNIVVGLIGSFIGTFIGGFISPKIGLQVPEIVNTLIWSTLGAVILLSLIRLFKKV